VTPLAVDLTLPFDTDHLRSIAVRDCDLTVRHQFRVPREKMDLQIMDLLASHGITISHAEAFVTPPRQLLPIHVDGPELNNIAKLNWQWGAQGSWMMWWKLKNGVQPTQRMTAIGTRYLTIEARDCIPIYRHQIKQPTLVNVGTPHSIMNMTSEHRWVLSLVLWDIQGDRALFFDEALERLSQLRSVQEP